MSTQQYARPGDTGHQCNILALQLLYIKERYNMIGLYKFVFLGNKQICLIVSVGYFGIFTFLTHVLQQDENGFSHNKDKEAMTKKKVLVHQKQSLVFGECTYKDE